MVPRVRAHAECLRPGHWPRQFRKSLPRQKEDLPSQGNWDRGVLKVMLLSSEFESFSMHGRYFVGFEYQG